MPVLLPPHLSSSTKRYDLISHCHAPPDGLTSSRPMPPHPRTPCWHIGTQRARVQSHIVHRCTGQWDVSVKHTEAVPQERLRAWAIINKLIAALRHLPSPVVVPSTLMPTQQLFRNPLARGSSTATMSPTDHAMVSHPPVGHRDHLDGISF